MRLRIAGIGASRGGLEAITELLGALITRMAMAYVAAVDGDVEPTTCRSPCRAPSMPRQAIADGCVDSVLRPREREKAAEPRRIQAAAKAPQLAATRSRRVMVVDDHDEIAKSVARSNAPARLAPPMVAPLVYPGMTGSVKAKRHPSPS
jgi:hypothetical protein